MNRAVIMLVVTLGLATAPAASAQTRPDLSGTWLLNYEKSSRGVSGNSPDVVFPSQLVVTQSSTELAVKASSVRQAPFSAVYRLDGSKVDVQAPTGITETAQASFEGTTLVITSRRSFPSPAGEIVVEFKDVWSVTGSALTITKTVTQDGEAQTETAVYDRPP
jgi:hypothetical protein